MDLDPSCSSTIVNIEVIPAENYLLTQPNSDSFMLCPLCNSEVKLFFINFNEKLLMCKNTECEYPFGYEELQFFKEDEDKCSETEVMSIRDNSSQTFTYADSAACWSDINKMHQVIDIDDISNLDNGALDVQEYMLNPTEPTKTKTMQMKETMQKNVQEISNLTNALTKSNNKKMLKNPKWIRNLTNLQRKTGAKLVKPIEMGSVSNSKEMFGGGELTINIGPPDNVLSTLKIEIKND